MTMETKPTMIETPKSKRQKLSTIHGNPYVSEQIFEGVSDNGLEIRQVMIEKPKDLTLEECQEAFALFRKQKSMKTKVATIFGIPDISEQILEGLSDNDLIQCLKVSSTLKEPAENVFVKRWKGKLFNACLNDKMKIVKLILDNLEPNSTELNAPIDELGRTIFIWACANGKTDVVKLLLTHPIGKHIEFNARDNNGYTGFTLACESGRIEIIKILLNHQRNRDIDMNATNHEGTTPFMAACTYERIGIVKLLLDHQDSHNIDFNVKDMIGKTALMLACEEKKIDIVKLLLDHPRSQQIDFNAEDDNGNTALINGCH